MGEYIIPTQEEILQKLTDYPREIDQVVADVHSEYKIDIFDLSDHDWRMALEGAKNVLTHLVNAGKVSIVGSTVQLRFPRQYGHPLWRFDEFHVSYNSRRGQGQGPSETPAVPQPVRKWIEHTCRRTITRVADFSRKTEYQGRTYIWDIDFGERRIVGEEMDAVEAERLYRAIWLSTPNAQAVEALAKESGCSHYLDAAVDCPEHSEVLPIGTLP